MKDGLHSINLIIDGTQYEYSQGDFIKLCEGELPAQENVLRHVLRLQKIAADNVAAELRRLRDEVKEYQFTIEEMKKEKRGRSRKA